MIQRFFGKWEKLARVLGNCVHVNNPACVNRKNQEFLLNNLNTNKLAIDFYLTTLN